VGVRLVPANQLQHQLDAFLVAHGGDAEHVLDVDDAEAAHLHVVLDQLRGPAHQHVARGAPHLHQIVGHQAVAAHDEIERRLRLPDAALAQRQHADADTSISTA
jgi:hypothetical protein